MSSSTQEQPPSKIETSANENEVFSGVEFARSIKARLEKNINIKEQIEGLLAQLSLLGEEVEDTEKRVQIQKEIEHLSGFLQKTETQIRDIKREVWDTVQDRETTGAGLVEHIISRLQEVATRDWGGGEFGRKLAVVAGKIVRAGGATAIVAGCAGPAGQVRGAETRVVPAVEINTYIEKGTQIVVEDESKKFDWKKQAKKTKIGTYVSINGEKKFIPRISMESFDPDFQLDEIGRRLDNERYEDWWDDLSSKEQDQITHFIKAMRWQKELFGTNGDGIRHILQSTNVSSRLSIVDRKIFELMRKHYMAIETLSDGIFVKDSFTHINNNFKNEMFGNSTLRFETETDFKNNQIFGVLEFFRKEISLAHAEVAHRTNSMTEIKNTRAKLLKKVIKKRKKVGKVASKSRAKNRVK